MTDAGAVQPAADVHRVAAVDVGTNSVRLLVAEADPGAAAGIRHVERLMRVTRLGAGVDATGHLDDAALTRTLDCLSDYRARWTELGAQAVRIAATSAVRDAADRDRFFDGAQQRTGVDAEVLTGEQEAATAFRGATSAVDGEAPYLVLDIGGGSTELILGTGTPAASTSRQLGCVRLTERALHADPPTPAQLEHARRIVDDELAAAAKAVPAGQARTLVGVAGTATTLGALHLGLSRYEPEAIHGVRVRHTEVRRLLEELAGMPASDRAALGPMAPGREDVIVGGAVILERVMERFGFDEVLVSEADILDGLAEGLLERSAGLG